MRRTLYCLAFTLPHLMPIGGREEPTLCRCCKRHVTPVVGCRRAGISHQLHFTPPIALSWPLSLCQTIAEKFGEHTGLNELLPPGVKTKSWWRNPKNLFFFLHSILLYRESSKIQPRQVCQICMRSLRSQIHIHIRNWLNQHLVPIKRFHK